MHRIAEGLSLFVLVAVIALRPLVAECYDSAGSAVAEALPGVSDPSPLRTLVFDVLILLAACGWLAGRALAPGRRYRRTGLEWGAPLIVVAAAVSCVVAGNKRLALNASLDWLSHLVLAVALVQLLTSGWHRRLLLAAMLATAGVQAVECFDQHFVGFDNTLDQYEHIKADFWAKQGVDLDSSKVDLFERRMRAREASGFLPHSNIAGSYLLMCGLAGLGLALAVWREAATGLGRARAAGCLMVVATVLGAVGLTGSLGAMLAGLAGVAAWLMVWRLRPWIDAHRRRFIIGVWAVALAGLLAWVGYGLCRNSFPHMSLTFRWQYWRASVAMIADRPLTGVGRENFGRHYLQYKDIESPEEVANPHNFLVQAAADWGILGLIGMAALLVGGSLAITRPMSGPSPPEAHPVRPSRRTVTAWAIGLALAVSLSRLPLLGASDPSFLYYTTVTGGLIWLAVFLLAAPTAAEFPTLSGRGARVTATALAIAVLAFLLHDLINFALFVPATATTFFALFAVGVAQRLPAADSRAAAKASRRRWLAPALAATATTAVILIVVLPVATAAHHLALAYAADRRPAAPPLTTRPSYRHYSAAIAADPLDPTPCVRRARWLTSVASTGQADRDEAMNLAAASLDEAVRRDPFNVAHRRDQARFFLLWAYRDREALATPGSADGAEHFAAAIEAAEHALRLYPLDPQGAADLGDYLLTAGRATGSAAWLHRAAQSYERALQLDDARLSWETIRRFRDRERTAIEQNLRRAQEALDGLR